MTKPYLHIISMDVPWPPDYGGVIDVFYKVKALNALGVEVNLHAFEYGRGSSKEISRLCNRVFYYPRNTHWSNAVTTMPYIVRSRISDDLIDNLKQDQHPILCEGLHTAAVLLNDEIDPARVFVRTANVEHHYYRHLFKDTGSIFKKIYYFTEAQRLYHFERNLAKSAGIIAISDADTAYFRQQFPDTRVETVYGFHAYDQPSALEGSGDFALYHGNLSVSENHMAAMFLINEVFNRTDYPLVISGKKPEQELLDLVEKFDHISVYADPTVEEMDQLIASAHMHVMPTFQPTGIKLKLLNALFRGRHVIVNENMLAGTQLHTITEVCNDADGMLKKVEVFRNQVFASQMIEERKRVLERDFSNQVNAEKLLSVLYGNKVPAIEPMADSTELT